MKKFLLLLLFWISQCGYQPIYSNNSQKNFDFFEIITQGENDINRNIINSISLREDKNNKLLNEFWLKTFFTVNETSKNSKGQVGSYRSSILVEVILKKNKNILKKKEFSKEFSYNNLANKFELVEYQNDIKDKLTNEVIEEIFLFLNLQ
jgi:hypothetical protein|tara:strand:+ start:3547 stop:3996 length:450 start_codon:yes stop_codon:yes gene_type:complete